MARYWSDMADRPTWVYRLYDDDGALLYVGLSMNLAGRFAKHAMRDWWPQVADIEVAKYPDRESAKVAERSAIHHEDPAHNVTRPRMECC